MPLLIDCYNVLHQTMPPSLAGLDERGLCVALSRSGWAGEQAVIVCDGTVKPHSPSTSEVQEIEGVELVYAGKGKSADDLILDLIEAQTAPRRLVVVTSDREIQKAARRRRARVMDSQEFIRELARSPAGPPTRRDRSGRPDLTQPLPPEEVERWLKRFGIKDDGGDQDKVGR